MIEAHIHQRFPFNDQRCAVYRQELIRTCNLNPASPKNGQRVQFFIPGFYNSRPADALRVDGSRVF